MTTFFFQVANDDTSVRGMRRDMLESLDKRYGDASDDSTYVCATMLDPRFKDMLFDNAHKARAMLEEEYQKIVRSDDHSTERPAKRAKLDLQGSFWDFVASKQGDAAVQNHDELNAYLAEPCIGPNSDPLDYWRCHEEQYPVLKVLARKFLCMQCTSVPSERLFSTAGLIVSERRSRLQPSKVQQLLFLNKNIDI